MENTAKKAAPLPVLAESQLAVLVNVNYETITRFVFSTGHSKFYSNQILGSFCGNIHDPVFVKKLNRVRGRIWISGINYSECPHPIDAKKMQRKSDRERYERKMGMLFKQFATKAEEIRNSGDIFWKENLKTLCDSWKENIPVIKKRYNQENVD